MNSLKILIIILLSTASLGFDWGIFSIQKKTSPPIQIQSVWTVDTVTEKILRPYLQNNSPPLITEELVVQGNAVNGIKAYKKDKGQLIWSFKISSGVASPVVLHEGNLYFGGADGFFYSLQLNTGRLSWKFWTGSENAGAPLIHKGRVYWTANNQKMYALTLKGKLLWIYSGASLPNGFFVRGRPRPVLYGKWIYTGFYQGSLVALNKDTGRLKWERSLSPFHPIREGMEISGNCLFVPVFDFYLFCLNPLNGKIRWKSKGGSSPYLNGKSAIYHSSPTVLYALRKFDGTKLWEKDIKSFILSPTVFGKKYLIYGYPSYGKLVFISVKDGKTLSEYQFGKGLAAPISLDQKNNSIYFLSVGGYLHKLFVL